MKLCIFYSTNKLSVLPLDGALCIYINLVKLFKALKIQHEYNKNGVTRSEIKK